MEHKAGFVNIVGNPNVGKSTLMNALVGERISIITSKSQTTRHRILGIVNGEDFQIVYSDTPGVLKPAYKLQESMMKFSNSALNDADVLLYVTDVYEKLDKNIEFIERVKKAEAPLILVINKVDRTEQEELEALVAQWKEIMPNAEIIPTSALEKFNLTPLLKRIKELLPVSPPFFDKEALTDKTERFFTQEIIREKALMQYKKEVPYSIEIVVEAFKEEEKIIRILATIHVARDSQKSIIIGHKGEAIKKLGTNARIDIEAFFKKKVYLELFVKVSKDWRDKNNNLRQFGYFDL